MTGPDNPPITETMIDAELRRRRKRRIIGGSAVAAVLAAVLVVILVVTMTADDEPSLEDRLIAECKKAVDENPGSIALSGDLLSMKFTGMKAAPFAGGAPGTDRWLVSGQLELEMQATSSVPANTWDSDGAAPAKTTDGGELKCRMGHRESDDQIVVFEFMHYHPTSGGGVGQQLVYEEDAGEQTSQWG